MVALLVDTLYYKRLHLNGDENSPNTLREYRTRNCDFFRKAASSTLE